MRRNANSPQIKSIRIPARLNGQVRMSPLMSMPFTGTVQQIEFVIGHLKQLTSQFRREICSPEPMIRIGAFIHAARIVKHCKQGNHDQIGPGRFRQSQPILQNPSPMRDTMIPMQRQCIVLKDAMNDHLEIQRFNKRVLHAQLLLIATFDPDSELLTYPASELPLDLDLSVPFQSSQIVYAGFWSVVQGLRFAA